MVVAVGTGSPLSSIPSRAMTWKISSPRERTTVAD